MPGRFLADEDVPRPLVKVLRASGYDVAFVLEDARGSLDEDHLSRAQREGRVLLTFDKEYGELVFRRGLPAHFGVILCRVTTTRTLAENIAMVTEALAGDVDWAGQFWVVSYEGIRSRAVPL